MVFGDHGKEWRRCAEADVPFVLVENDVASLRSRSTASVDNEREMHAAARAVLYPSEAMRDVCVARYKPAHTEVVMLRPLARDLAFEPRPREERTLVYAGGIRDIGAARGRGYGYRLYHDIFAAAIAAGWRVIVHPSARTGELSGYAAIGVEVREHVPARDLYQALSGYAVGLQGYAEEGYGTRYCVPNKTWEYLAAGIPTLGVNGGLAARIYHGRWGIAGGVEDVAKNLARLEWFDVPANVRAREVMDADAPAFDRLVAALA